jgi:hypothetical protein
LATKKSFRKISYHKIYNSGVMCATALPAKQRNLYFITIQIFNEIYSECRNANKEYITNLFTQSKKLNELGG